MKVGVLLSGCGVLDGSEVYESVLTLLALERGGATVVAMAPDIQQAEVVNHYTGQEDRLEGRDVLAGSGRNVLAEAARIVRGQITSTNEISAHDIDALVIPGGFGATKNLCTYAADGVQGHVNRDVQRLIGELHGLGKPIGAMCAGPILLALALPDRQISLTVGNDGKSAVDLLEMGAQHVNTTVGEIHVDEANKIVSTAAFMLAQTPGEAEAGINALVARVLGWARENAPQYSGETNTSAITADMPAHD
jgi:enhancing lycopene biosynthesis protein 2